MDKRGKRKNRSKSQGDLDDYEIGNSLNLKLTYGRKEYEDGIYEGYFHKGLRHGRGSMKGKNGFVFFEGKWENDQPNGYGIMKFPHSGDRHEGNYRQGKRDGLGVFLWANGDKYSGHFKQGVMHGYGRFEWVTGDVYNGDFCEGKAEGDGFKIYADGRKSYGMFSNSLEHGWIKETWPDGDSYNGFVEENQISGYGCFDWLKGDRYEGQWKDEVFHGLGCYTLISGSGMDKKVTDMRGNFEKGEFRGLGYYKSEESDFEYFGEFKKDKEELAWAHIEYDNGIHYDGDTLQLNRQGQGQLSYSKIPFSFLQDEELDIEPFSLQRLNTFGDLLENIQTYGARFIGIFEDDMPHGRGELFLVTGEMYSLEFAHGIVIR